MSKSGLMLKPNPDEIIEELIVTDFANRFPYWIEVKQEIEKL